jgi:hypothetical protein
MWTERILNSSHTTSMIFYTLTFSLIIIIHFNAVFFKVYTVSQLFLQKLHAPAELSFWKYGNITNCFPIAEVPITNRKEQYELKKGAKAGSRTKETVTWANEIKLWCISGNQFLYA